LIGLGILAMNKLRDKLRSGSFISNLELDFPFGSDSLFFIHETNA
jgi:hypothetical protein